ncbi:MAG: vanadium-dependent haloperoxidase [Tabrizicola sp.]|uniref:vanadium-dependent haloperoxidase n=1 Tax=Tabrizicola sp. TaxID=2005166 RepID=UPI002ABA1184|nr:vanadium-dependent haloperoxidase [Tabrizicola sp.]MDZ4087398.1 vanadium-dependent haloperoxidase [Tabrizicola sp.]
MPFHRRQVLGFTISAPFALSLKPAHAANRADVSREVLLMWHKLILELVRHTATYVPPVAARAFAYIGITAHEALATGNPALRSLAGQLTALPPLPPRAAGEHDEPCVLHAALTAAVTNLFSNTGPTGQRAMEAMARKMGEMASDGIAAEVVARSVAAGQAVADHILTWAATDGGAVIANMGFPIEYTPGTRPQDWVPTNLIRLQQAPLLPQWAQNRPFAMPAADACDAPPHPAYDEAPGTDFHAAALEVYDTSRALTDEQRLIARFWSDDPMLTPTPAGHWIAIVLQIADRDALPVEVISSTLAKLGVAQADAFISCWSTKFKYNLLRPVTYIKRHIDPAWEPLLITPPFPEYTSGHSTQSGAASTVLTSVLGKDFAFDDATHVDEGFEPRRFPSFAAAAEEAALSRLYGGIHFRFGNQAGLDQGRAVGAYAAALRTEA